MAITQIRGTQIGPLDLTTEVSGILPLANGGTGTSTGVTRFNIRTVASSTATAAEKASANFVCDGTADETEINSALSQLQTIGGTVVLSGGTFNLSATIAFTGGANFADNPYVELLGQGADSTILAPASGVHAITLTNTPKPGIKKLRINVSGASDGIRCIAPTTGANDRRGFWMGAFEDLKIQGDFSTHSGWAINMESPFRSTFKRIQGLGIKNGIWLKSHFANFNPGNLTFDDCHMDLNLANGTAYFLDTNDNGGFFNICTFMECDAIDSNGSSTTSIGWRFRGSGTTFYTTRDILVLRSNVEQFNTAVSIEHSANVEFNGNYMDTKTNGTLFHVSADSPNNQLSAQYIYVPSPKTTKAINDLNTDALKPTTLRNSFTRVETGGTLTVTKTAATVLTGLYRDSDGTGVYPSEWQGQTAPLNVLDEGTELFRGTRKINFVGTGVTTTNTGPDVTVTIPGSAGGTNATNLTTTAAPSTVTINSDTGTDAIIAATDATNAGLFLPAEKTKLTGIATGATANSTDAQLRDRTTHTGSSEPFTAAALPGTRVANTLYADSTNDCLTYVNSDINKSLQIGQEQWIKVTNTTGASIANGTPVYITGQSGGVPTVAPAQANTLLTSIVIGLTTETIANNGTGYVTSSGLVRDINTSAFTAGALVYLSSTAAGGLVTTIPSHPNYRYRVGVVTMSNATTGAILVTPATSDVVLNVTVSNTAPASPVLNDLWVDTN